MMAITSALLLLGCLAPPYGAHSQTTTTFQYDPMGRLGRATEAGGRESETTFTYDAAGNRVRVTTTVSKPIIENESFEHPSTDSFVYRPASHSALGHLFYGTSGVARNGSAWNFPAPWAGEQVAFLQGSENQHGWLKITDSGLTPGKTYRITFAAAQRPGFPPNQLTVSAGAQQIWSGVPAAASHFTPYPTSPFVATAGTIVLTFSATATSYDSASAIDAIGVELLP